MKVMWIAAMTLAGGLMGMNKGWHRQLCDAFGCAVALAVACWQYPRVAPYVRLIWGDVAPRQVALIYLFVAMYELLRALIWPVVPSDGDLDHRRWAAGLGGALQAGVLATLAILLLPRA